MGQSSGRRWLGRLRTGRATAARFCIARAHDERHARHAAGRGLRLPVEEREPGHYVIIGIHKNAGVGIWRASGEHHIDRRKGGGHIFRRSGRFLGYPLFRLMPALLARLGLARGGALVPAQQT